MTNQYSSLISEKKSDKRVLIRVEVARNIKDYLTLDSGTTYTLSFHEDNIHSLKADGVSFNEVAGTPSSGEYSFDSETKLLTVTLAAAPAAYTAIVVKYYLFFTDGPSIYCYSDPLDSNTTVRYWESRVNSLPSFSHVHENILLGGVEIGNTSFSLLNTDYSLNHHFGKNQSLYNKEVKIWHYLNNPENVALYFVGKISSVSIGQEINFSVDSQFNVLKETFYSAGDEASSRITSTLYANSMEGDRNKPIPKHFCKRSKTEDIIFSEDTNTPWNGIGPSTTSTLKPNYFFDKGFKLFNISYSQNQTGTTNRTWLACVNPGGTNSVSETAANVTTISTAFGDRVYETDVADSSLYMPGDNIRVNGTWGLYMVYAIISSTRIQIHMNTGTLSNGHSLYRPVISAVNIVYKSKIYSLAYNDHYTESVDGNGNILVTFVNNFEALSNFSGTELGTDYLAPNSNIFYRAWNLNELGMGTVCEEILDQKGITLKASLISGLDSFLKCNFSVPYYGDSELPKTIDLLSSILNSSLSMLSLETDMTAGIYNLSSNDAFIFDQQITENEIVEGSIQSEIRFSDIYNFLKFQNSHGPLWFHELNGVVAPYVYQRFNEAATSIYPSYESKYLHDIESTFEFEIVTEAPTALLNRIRDFLSSQKYFLTIRVRGLTFTPTVGDTVDIVSDKIIFNFDSTLSSGYTTNFWIAGVTKYSTETELRLIRFSNY